MTTRGRIEGGASIRWQGYPEQAATFATVSGDANCKPSDLDGPALNLQEGTMNAKEWIEVNGISVGRGKLRILAQEASPMAPFFQVLMERFAEQYAAYKVKEFAGRAEGCVHSVIGGSDDAYEIVKRIRAAVKEVTK